MYGLPVLHLWPIAIFLLGFEAVNKVRILVILACDRDRVVVEVFNSMLRKMLDYDKDGLLSTT